MKRKTAAALTLLFFVIPFNLSLYINLSTASATTEEAQPVPFEKEKVFDIATEKEETKNKYVSKAELSDSKVKVKVFIKDTGEVKEMTLHDYVICAVAGEMPATFELEALKAQAVAARTFTVKHLSSSCASNRNANVCTYYGCCQAYVSNEQMKKNWGNSYEEKYEKIKRAVEETDGLCMYYNNEPITVFYFSTSNGHTDACQDVFVKTLPYYKSVESPGEETAPRYYSYVKITYESFLQKLKESYGINITKEALISDTSQTFTEGGRTATISFGEKSIKGTSFRTAFGLRSADFHITYNENEILIEVYGNGHGCGMSQLGAEYMAEKGSNHLEILSHYYIDVEIK